MPDQPANPDNPLPIWDRLRESLEHMRTALGRKTDPEARAKTLADRASLMRKQKGSVQPTGTPLYFLSFTKGRERYGIPLENVLEVQALEQFSPVPGAPAWIRGVVHWRGSILALLDLTRMFEVAESGLSDLLAYIVVEAAGKRLAVAATQVDDICNVPHETLQAPPVLNSKIAPEWVVGVHDENQLILKMGDIFQHLEKNS